MTSSVSFDTRTQTSTRTSARRSIPRGPYQRIADTSESRLGSLAFVQVSCLRLGQVEDERVECSLYLLCELACTL